MSILTCLVNKVSDEDFAEYREVYQEMLDQSDGNTTLADAKFKTWAEKALPRVKRLRMQNAVDTVRVRAALADIGKAKEARWKSFNRVAQAAMRATGSHHVPSDLNNLRTLMQGADDTGHGAMQEIAGRMSRAFEKAGLDMKALHAGANVREMRQLAIGLDMGPAHVPPELRQLVIDMGTIRDILITEHRRMGGPMQRIKNWLPIHHDPKKLKAAGVGAWTHAYMGMWDRPNMIDWSTGMPLSDLKGSRLSTQTFNRITGVAESSRKEFGMFPEHSGSRFTFLRAGEWIRYNDEFGAGDDGIFQLLLEGFTRQAHMNGVNSRLGIQPGRTLDSVGQSLNAVEGKSASAMFGALMRTWSGPSTLDTMAVGMQMMTDLRVASSLGMTPLVSVSDAIAAPLAVATNGLLARNGAWVTLKAYAGSVKNNPSQRLRDASVLDMLRSNDNLMRMIVGDEGNFDPDSRVLEVTGWLREKSLRWTGTPHMTMRGGNIAVINAFDTLSQYVDDGIKWADLPEEVKPVFAGIGLNRQDWEKILQHPPDPSGFLNPSTMPPELNDVRVKLNALDAQVRRMGTGAPSLRQRSITSGRRVGAASPNDKLHQLSKWAGTFKGWSFEILSNVLLPVLGDIHRLDKIGQTSAAVVGGPALGMVLVQSLAILKGEPLYSTETPEDLFKLYKAGAMQSGLASFYGDFLAKEPSAVFGGWLSTLAGPQAGTVIKGGEAMWHVFQAATDNQIDLDYTKFTGVAKDLVPFRTAWPIQLGVNRLAVDQLNQMMDPSFYRKQKRIKQRMQEERGNSQSWWEAGERLPEAMQ